MYLLFFLVWVIFNGQITLEIAIFGLVIAAVVYAFTCKFLDWSPSRDLFLFRKCGQILGYTGLLIWEIVKANASTLAMILSPKLEPDPVVVHIRTKLKSRTAKVLLANSITLTPGTITVALEGDELTVHCLDRSFSEGLADSTFEQALLKLEAPFGQKKEEKR